MRSPGNLKRETPSAQRITPLTNLIESAMTHRMLRHLALAAICTGAALLTACGGDDDPAPPPAPPAAVAPTITTPPAAVAVNEGAPATFSVVAAGTAPLSYQWLRGGVSISGATSATYTLAAATTGDDGAAFAVRVSNSAGSVTSSAALLALNRRPVVVTQPASVTVAELNTVTLTAAADGTAPFTYQWQRSTDGTTWTDIATATSASHTTPQLLRTDSGTSYRVVVNNVTNQPVTSTAAQVTVTPDGAVALASGGTVSGDNDKIRLQIAAGVLAGPTRFAFTPSTTFDGLPAGYTLASGTAYDITWSGVGFAAGRQVAFGIKTAAPAVVAADHVRVANTPNPPMTAVSNCPSGTAFVSPSSDQGGGYQGASATLCEGDGRVPTRVGLANPPPPPPTGPWTQVGVPALQRALSSVAFAGPSVAVALGTEARYIRSTNGGLSWTQSTGPLASNESGTIAFADANVGIIVSSRSTGGTIYRTTNAGANWSFAFNSGRMRSVAFGSPTVGVAVGLSSSGIPARILRTADAGVTWTESTVSGHGLTDFTDVAFADVNTVVVVGGVTRRSTDGGQTFSPVTTPPGDAYQVAFGSPQVGVVVGFSGQVFWTADGGQNWTAGTGAALATVVRFHDVTFLDATTAIAVGQGAGRGVILRSGDGGRTWTSVDAGITGVLVNYAVAFGSPTVGVVTGDTGSVLRTTTGGL
jgi:photosystem II stability/assembly factor-like uncharacterized protein